MWLQEYDQHFGMGKYLRDSCLTKEIGVSHIRSKIDHVHRSFAFILYPAFYLLGCGPSSGAGRRSAQSGVVDTRLVRHWSLEEFKGQPDGCSERRRERDCFVCPLLCCASLVIILRSMLRRALVLSECVG